MNPRNLSLSHQLTGLALVSTMTLGVVVAVGAQQTGSNPVHHHAGALHQSYYAAGLPSTVGVAMTPVGGGETLTFGSQKPHEAWSTMKVPLSVAALRHSTNDPEIAEAVEAAIVDSDNDAALALRKSLGTPQQAYERVTAVLREGGDPDVQLHPIARSDEIFGLTMWPLAGSATFAAHLPCMRGTAAIIGYMGEVSEEQQWGLDVIRAPGIRVAVKGGWGEADEVRQLGLITWPDGQQLAVAMLSYRVGETTGEGIAELNRVAQWLEENLTSLPRGRCR